MARYKAIDTSPRFLAVDLEKQLLPGKPLAWRLPPSQKAECSS